MVEKVQPIIDVISQLFTAAIGWVGQTATVVMEQPLLLVFASLSLVGLGVGLFMRLKSN